MEATMAHIRILANGRIQFDLHFYGCRFREGTKLMATPKNLVSAKANLKQMNAEIDLGSFQYRDYFPKSKKVAKFESYNEINIPTANIHFLIYLLISGLNDKKPNGKKVTAILCVISYINT